MGVISMAEKNNSTCAICGKGYYLCLSCKSHKLTPWKLHTDTSEHYKIFQILRGAFLNVYTKEEAKEKLENLDLSDLDTFNDNVKSQIKEIMDYKVDTNVVESTTKKSVKKRKSTQVVETE